MSLGYDVQFPGQHYFSVNVEANKVFCCYHLLPDQTGTCLEVVEVVPYREFPSSQEGVWANMKLSREEVPTSENSTLPPLIQASTKSGKRKRSSKEKLMPRQRLQNEPVYHAGKKQSEYEHIYLASTKVTTRNSLPFTHLRFAEACKFRKTRHHVQAMLPIIENACSLTKRNFMFVNRKSGIRARRIVAFKELTTTLVEKNACRLVWYQGEKMFIDVSVMSDSLFLLRYGLDGFSDTGEALYRTPRAAARALCVYCLLHISYVNGNIVDGLPRWLKDQMMIKDQSFPMFIFLNDVPILCHNKRMNSCRQSVLMGTVTRNKSGKYFFSFPQDDYEENIRFNQDFWTTVPLAAPS